MHGGKDVQLFVSMGENEAGENAGGRRWHYTGKTNEQSSDELSSQE